MTGQTRVQIGHIYKNRPKWQKILAIPFIYIPILIFIPILIITVIIVRWHLTITGAQNIKKYKDFTPNWLSHRYTYATQITWHEGIFFKPLMKIFWIFNCKLYCPLTVALIKYLLYLVQIVELWWCPFDHNKKNTYFNSKIDKSFWHTHSLRERMLDDKDKLNSLWNKDI